MKKLLLVLLLLLLPSGAWAQKTKAALTTEVNTNLASSSNITASILRTTILDIINSFYDLNGLTSLSCGSNTFISAFPTLSSATCTQPSFANLSGTLLAAQFPALTGDITTTLGSLTTTLATVNANVGTFGSVTTCVSVTNNAKGLTTAISAATCTPAIGSVTGLGVGIATALGVNVGTAGSIVTNGGVLGTPSSGVATNLTGTAAGLTAGTVTTNANLTGDVTSVGNATTVTGINGVNQNAAWTVYSPTVSAQGGTITAATITSTGRYKQIGKTVIAEVDVTLTNVGTGAPAGSMIVTIPLTAAAFRYVGSCYEYTTTGKSGAGFINVSGANFSTRDATGVTWFTNGYTVACTVTYEVP